MNKFRTKQRWRKLWVSRFLNILWVCLLSICLGWGLAVGRQPAPSVAQPAVGGVDVVPPELQLSEQAYLQYCATCHVGVPPQVLPSQTWQTLLTDPQHYGLQLKPIPRADQSVIINYIAAYAYPLKPEETIPFRVGRSRFFRILHPQVQLPQPITLAGCVSCHPGAKQFDYRRLSAEWP